MRLLPLILLGACGTPLADEAFRGVPLVEVRVEIEPEHDIPNDHLHLAVFWDPADAAAPQAQLIDTTVAGLNLPSRTAIRLFDPPVADPGTVGRLVLFRDRDQDGRLGADDTLHGVVPGALVLDDSCPAAIGWRATCDAPCTAPPPDAVLDPLLNFTWRPFCEATE